MHRYAKEDTMKLFGRGQKSEEKDIKMNVQEAQDDAPDTEESDDKVIVVKRTMSRKARMLAVIFAMLLLLGIVAAYMRYNSIKTYESYSVVSSDETSGDNLADYTIFAGNVLKVTKDGASYIDEDGVTKWDVSYAMRMPQAEVCGNYAIVTDMNGKDVYVFNTEGEVSRQSLNYDISNADVAEQGVYCLVLAGEDGNYIKCYDKDSSIIYEQKISIENGGYPIDIDISDDGEKLIVSCMRVAGTRTETVISAYNFGSVGQNENADRLMGSYTIEDSLYPIVKFTDNDTIVCFGDKDIRIYRMVEKPEERCVIALDGREMQGVFCNSGYVGYICLSSADSGAKYNVYIYDNSGNLKATSEYDASYDSIYATEDEIIIIGDMDCCIMRFNGTVKFSYSFSKALVNVVPDSKDEEYVVIFENETQTIALK